MEKKTSKDIGGVRWRRLFLNRWVGLFFLLLLGGFVISVVVFNNPYVWPFVELGVETSFLLGCTTLACFPLAWGIGILYTYLFAVLMNVFKIYVIDG